MTTSNPEALPATDTTTTVIGLRTTDGSGLVATACPEPRLSWSLASERPGVLQQAYEIQVSPDPSFAEAASSGAVEADEVTDHPWPAERLRSREVRHWRVRVRTDLGWTGWSDPARVEASLLDAADWTARPVHVPSDRGRTTPGPVPLLRREFELPAEPVSARLYVSALGVHRTAINGRPVSDELLEPGWTSYPNRLLYATYDVTGLLTPGRNALCAAVGDGWYRGHLTWHKIRDVYGDASALLAQLEVTLADGSTVTVATDERWRGGYGDLLAADLYDGCERDLRHEPRGWRLPGFDDHGWEPAATLPLPAGLTQRAHPPVRVVQVIQPELRTLPDGTIAVDAGENITGWLRLRVNGPAASAITVRHAEVLDGDGRLLTSILRGARATDCYTLAGGGADLEPEFTFHGFRYAEIDASGGVRIEAVEVAVVASDLPRVGEFRCSDERVNALYGNVVRSQRGNFLAVPTDCPQRDERLGWTGDLMAFAQTACATFDSRAFLDSWLTDLGIEQRADGAVPMVVPDVPLGELPPTELPFAGSAAGWGDAATVVPAALFDAYGQRDLLARHYPAMRAWVEFTTGLLDDGGTWTANAQLGDWLDPAAPPEDPARATTDSAYVATAFVAHSARLLADAARVLGRTDDADRYAALHRRTASAAWRTWGDHARTTQTGCALALEFGIAPAAERSAVGDALAALVRASDGRIATGFLGTPFVLPALTSTGHTAEAYQLLLNTECPGWLYQVERGATTMWERWDAIRPDGTVDVEKAGTMLSFNHYAYGAVAAWLYRSVAGLRPTAPGYRAVEIAPRPGGGLTSASASITTPYGPVSVAWEVSGATLTVDLLLPPGTGGRFVPPDGWRLVAGSGELRSGRHRQVLRAAALGLDEKTALLSGQDMWSTKPAERAAIPALVLSDGPHGVRRQRQDTDPLGLYDSEPATCFPPAAALASSWDEELVGQVGEALGREARALGVDVLLGPGVNIKRSPLCGRNFEYFSEDPLLSGVLGAAHVRGVQSRGVGASVKHFAANNQETDRMRVSADVDERTLREIYLPAFERIVAQARPATVMCSYNRINGTCASESRWLLTQLLREEWGFDGLVVSDWGAVGDRVAALLAGTDLEMPGSSRGTDAEVAAAVRSGELDEAVVDTAVARLAALAGRVHTEADPPPVDLDAHHRLAREVAADCLVLLKNQDRTLPLAPTGRIAVIGEFAATPRYQGGGSSHVNATRVDSPLDELRALLPDARLDFAQGYDTTGRSDAAHLREEAAALAAGADTAVLVVGLREADESEGYDREHLLLPREQVELVRAVARAARRTAVVLLGGGVVSLEGWHDEVDAVVEAWLPGQAGGGAIADVLTGRVNPSGRLAETIPLRLGDTPSFLNFPGEQGHVRYGEGVMVGYRYYETADVAVRYPFGHGLSYTSFDRTGFHATADGPDTATVWVTVTNTGDRFGKHVVQIYVTAPQRPVSSPARELRGFAKVALAAGESTTVEISLDRRAFAYWDITRGDWTVAPGRYQVHLADNAHDVVATATLDLPGDDLVRPLTLDSSAGDWFGHPVVGPALNAALVSGLTEEEAAAATAGTAGALRLLSSMAMRQFLGFLPRRLPDELLEHLMERTGPSARDDA